jgi:predicted TIM-barrel fold metal-dependent hydrolase
MADYAMISADSHVIEPRELWLERTDKEFRDKAPQWVKDPPGKEGEWFLVDGADPVRPVVTFSAGLTPEQLPEHQANATIDDCIKGAYVPEERLKDMELDGLSAEVIYSTHGLFMFKLEDAPYQRAIFRAFNDWLADFCSYSPKKLLGAALVSVYDVDDAVKELHRCAKMGLRGAMIPCSLPDFQSYSDPKYDALWGASTELNIPLTLHVVTGHGLEAKYGPWVSSMCNFHDVQRTLTDIVLNGVLDRFPELKLISSENDIGWVPHYLYRADDHYERSKYLRQASLKLLPSEYFRRQIYVTYMDDTIGVRNADYYGEDNYAWSSDYPHIGSTWPRSQEVVEKNFEGVSAEVQRKITRDNVARLYDMDLS